MDYQIEQRIVETLQEKLQSIWGIKSMFGFKIIICADGTEVVDRSLKTPYKALTPEQMIQYTNMDVQLAIMDRMERNAKKEAEYRQKLARNPIYRVACLLGLV